MKTRNCLCRSVESMSGNIIQTKSTERLEQSVNHYEAVINDNKITRLRGANRYSRINKEINIKKVKTVIII